MKLAPLSAKGRRRLLILGGLVLHFTIVYTVFAHMGITCLFQHILHIPCPGCGMTRAFLSLLRLDFAAAWHYNPLIFCMPYVFIYIFFDLRPEWLHRRLLAIIGVLALVNWTFVLWQH